MICKNGGNAETATKKYVTALLEKSEEAYLMALEIINKPTIKYRTEGFCFFICNARELLLKAFIIRREGRIEAINFKGNKNQSFGLQECIEKVFTSTTDYTKLNLNIIREIRNKSTHNILPDYDFKFASVFQRCISNLNMFFKKHFAEHKLNEQVTAFVALSNLPDEVNSPLSLNPSSVFYLKMMEEKIEGDSADLITQTIKLVSTKKSKDADIRFSLSNNADKSIAFINVPKDVNILYPYSAAQAVGKIQETLNLSLGIDHGFTMTSFTSICRDKNIKDNQEYSYSVNYSKNGVRKYSDKIIEYIVYIYSDEETRKIYQRKQTQKKKD